MYCLIINAVTFTLDEQRRDPRCICELQPAFICHADEEPVADIHIPTCIYRCTFLDVDMKFCENFRQSRISADKRFPICRSSRAAGVESTFGAIAGAKLYHYHRLCKFLTFREDKS